MPNYNVFSDLRDPLTVENIAASSAENGVNYRITTGIVSVPANNFVAVQLNNPSTSVYTARIGRIFGGALVNTAVHLLRNGTVTGGTTLTPINTNFGYPNTSQLIPTFSVSSVNPAVGGQTFSTIIQTGGPIEDDELGEIVIPPNNKLIIDLQSLSGGTNTMAITIGWAEVSPVS
ncbi:hypothetical protein HPT25_19240 [Bacillus sp. BRMEA1]|uniref:hypothetical protein n=1 Tax=Neobacillus endophyticus TaxID=2738405 RepID=UPI0015652785|nr:hypothetical protein [Neobacillus endophyticus]NRD79500.1 hypothetical protein [Neobacillus endophyticus]